MAIGVKTMKNIDINVLHNEFGEIVSDYLFNVSTLQNHNHFRIREEYDSRHRYYHGKGFPLLMSNKDNEYVVDEENFLEGCTRVFLINPMIKKLLVLHGIRDDWRFGDTFSDTFHLPNRLYENDAYVEFIFEQNQKRIGCRYTRSSYSSTETAVMERDNTYCIHHKPIPGFDVLSPIDEVWSIDWSGITDEELASICRVPDGMASYNRPISVRAFFSEIFSTTEYELFLEVARNAICEAQNIIALKAVPQLRSNNMLIFKDVVIESFSEAAVAQRSYEFKDGVVPTSKVLSGQDIQTIGQAFFADKYREAIIGNSDFAKSFITSEYLFRSVSQGLGIDYTSIVVGYLKSIEQLMYLLYLSAFGCNKRMQYWDVCRHKSEKDFDPTLPGFRYDPYDTTNTRRQEYFYHKIRVGDEAMEFGGLALFMRYYNKLWNVSDDGKEYIYACLDDFRYSCRNAHFHKDNISFEEYGTVKRIRNNTQVLLFYLLGGFKLLDTRSSAIEQLGVADYSFDRLFQNIWYRRRRTFWVKISGGYEGIICYINHASQFIFDEAGRLMQGNLHFVTFPGISQEDAVIKELNTLRDSAEYVKANSLVITRDTAIEQIEPFLPRRKG